VFVVSDAGSVWRVLVHVSRLCVCVCVCVGGGCCCGCRVFLLMMCFGVLLLFCFFVLMGINRSCDESSIDQLFIMV
jgi:hypothetical protein